MSREKALDTGIFWAASALAVMLRPVASLFVLVGFKLDTTGEALDEVTRGFKYKYRDQT